MEHSPEQCCEILIVDDIPANLSILTKILRQEGYHVRPALNGELALKAVQKSLPDLILLDIMMPGINGYHVCQELKVNERTRDIPILFISALDDPMEKVKAFEMGGVDFITKPFHAREVLARVNTQLQLQQMRRQLQAQNARLRQEVQEREQTGRILQQRNRELVLVNQVGQLFSSSLQLDEVLETALSEIQRLLDTFSTSFWLLDPETDELVCMHAKGSGSESLVNVRLSNGQGISGWAVTHNEIILVDDLDADERHAKQVTRQTGSSLRSMMSIPLRAAGTVIGVLNLVDPRIAHFTRDDVTFLEPIAAEAAIAIENARLYTMAQQEITERKRAERSLRWYTWQLARLNTMNNALQECATEQETYHAVKDTCVQIFSSDSGYIALLDDSHSRLHPVLSWGAFSSHDEPFTSSECGLVRRKGSVPVSLEDVQTTCSRLNCCAGTTLPHCLCLPLKTPDEVLGVFSLCATDSPKEPETDEEHHFDHKQIIARRLAEHYALSLANLRLRETLRRESLRDPLTGLYNRRYMEESLHQISSRAIRRNLTVAILMFDIDHFKVFNDTYGHEAGDIVLEALGRLLAEMFRGEDIACRYGGEEFLLILPDMSLNYASKRAEDLLQRVRNLAVRYEDTPLTITISIGVALFPSQDDTIHEVVSIADSALYQAKQQGRNQVITAASLC